MEPGLVAYAVIFVGSVALCWTMTPLALRFAVRTNILDRPGSYKAQTAPIPYLGGAAIVVAFGSSILIGALLVRPGAGLEQFPLVMLLALALSLMGLLDDVKGLNLFLRLGAEIGVGVAVWVAGIRIALFDVAAIDCLITVLWIVGITNAFNLIDNMDGLSAGVAAISAMSFFVIGALSGQFLVAGFAVAVAGCAVGFLRHNFHPAKIYMGDAGSLFFGFVLAVIGIKLRFEAPTQVTFMVPILVLGIPIFDTLLVVTTRLINRVNPLSGGRDHMSHRLVFIGIPVPVTVALIYGGQIALGWLALIMSRLQVTTGYMLMGFVVAVGAFFAVLLGSVPVYEQSTRRRLMIQEVKDHEVEPEADERTSA